MPSGRTSQRLGDILTQEGRLSVLQLRSLLREQSELAASRTQRPRLGELMMRHGLLDDVDLARALAVQYGCRYLDPDPRKVRPELFDDIPTTLLKSYRFVPLGRDQESITIAVSEFDEPDLDEVLRQVTGLEPAPVVTTRARLDDLRDSFHASRQAAEDRIEVVQEEPAPAQPPPRAVPPAPAAAIQAAPSSAGRVVPEADPAGEPIEIPFPRAMDHLVYRLMQTSLRERYSNVAFTPGETHARVLARRLGGRTDQTAIAAATRHRIRRALARTMGLEEGALRAAVCRKLRWSHDDGVALFEVALFPASNPQLEVNLQCVQETSWSYAEAGVAPAAIQLIREGLSDSGGLVVLSGRAPRDSWRLWVAMLAALAAEGRKVLAYERNMSHEIPGVFHHDIREGDAAGRGLFSDAARSAFAASRSDVLALRTDELPPDTGCLLDLAREESTVLMTVAASSPMGALRRLEQVTRTTLTTGLYVTAYRMPRLCPFCREGFPIASEGLPRGTSGLSGKVAYRSPGCDVCQFSGQFGTLHFYEVLKLDGDRLDRDGIDFYSRPLKEYLLEEGMLVPAMPAARQALLGGVIGLDDYLAMTNRE